MTTELLALPPSLKGDWEHAVFLSYGIDVAFFENALMRDLPARCGNKLILVDGQRYVDVNERLTRTGLTRYINQRYTLAGIFLPQQRAAHAKIVLLTSPGGGRLLVGSGNIGMQGYASGGELFTRYDLDAEDPDPLALSAMLGTIELLEQLLERDYIDESQARKHLRQLQERTPWLYTGGQNTPPVASPVHHNLDTPLLDTFVDAIQGSPVEELWVMAPFHDEGLRALQAAIDRLEVSETHVLVQNGSTSVDPGALGALLKDRSGKISIWDCKRSDCERPPYLHAKLLLAKTAEHAFCLQGSPNSSIVALLRATTSLTPGNLEAANLFEGPRDAFDYLLEPLERSNVTDTVATLDVRYQGVDEAEREPDDDEPDRCVLTSARWRDVRMWVTLRGDAPPLAQATLLIDGRPAAGAWANTSAHAADFQLDKEKVKVPTGPFEIRLAWDGPQTLTTNAVFVADLATLDREMEAAGSTEKLGRFGDLEFEDKELFQLLADLDDALILDSKSIWQMQQGRKRPAPDDEQALEIAYQDIDYDRLKQHPKIQQYLRARSWHAAPESTRLGMILSSILSHFHELGDVEPATRRLERALQQAQEASQQETEDDREEEAALLEARVRDMDRRIRDALKRFIRRYLDGVQSATFRELAGPQVLSRNYSVFSQLLWRLLAKSRLEPEEILRALMAHWAWFWGDDDRTGYVDSIDQEARTEVMQWLEDGPTAIQLLSSLAYGGTYCEQAHDEPLHCALRDHARRLVQRLPGGVTREAVEKAWHALDEITPDTALRPPDLADAIERLCHFETQGELLVWLRERYGVGSERIGFQTQKVKIVEFGGADHHVKVLTVDAESAFESPDDAIAVLARWMQVERLDYYRVHRPHPHHRGMVDVMAYYIPKEGRGLYYRAAPRPDEHPLGDILPQSGPWDDALQQVRDAASLLDESLQMDPIPVEMHAAGRD